MLIILLLLSSLTSILILASYEATLAIVDSHVVAIRDTAHTYHNSS